MIKIMNQGSSLNRVKIFYLILFFIFFFLTFASSDNEFNVSIEEYFTEISSDAECNEVCPTAITDSGGGNPDGNHDYENIIDSSSVSFKVQGCFVAKICKNVNVPRIGLRNLCRTQVVCQ